MSVEIRYTLEGRTVDARRFFDGIHGQIRRLAVEQVTTKVSAVRCPAHGRPAQVSEVRETGDGFDFTVTGCCDDAVERAERSL
jgi:hypothetical protein